MPRKADTTRTHYKGDGCDEPHGRVCRKYAGHEVEPCDHICDMDPRHRGQHHCPICRTYWEGGNDE